jgi:hypothetical protein
VARAWQAASSPDPVNRDADDYLRPLPMEDFYSRNASFVVRILATLEHAARLRRRKEPLPELFISDLLGEQSQGLRRPGERCARFYGLSAALVEFAEGGPDPPQLAGQLEFLREFFRFH